MPPFVFGQGHRLEPGGHDYVVCATHRSGSTLLCSLLRGTGVAGVPREHIQRLGLGLRHGPFDPNRDRDIIALLPERSSRRQPPRLDGMIERARTDGTGPDGVRGTHVMWRNLFALAEMLGRRPDDLISELTPRLRCVHMTRRDRVGQAVSYWTAWQTGSWGADQPERREPVYHFRAIDRLVHFLEEQDRRWREMFETAGIEAHTVTYEDLVANREETVRGVLRYIGVRDDVAVPPPSMRRQGGTRSAAWIARYLSER